MQTRKLGRTDIDVSRICLGCWAFAGDFMWGPQDEADSIATVHAALALGVNFLDTAEMYGNGTSEEVLGRALAGRRQEAVIATKAMSNHLAPDELVAACEASLRRLQTDYIDLYQIHWPSREIPLAETMAALEGLKAAGKIRAIGVSNFGPLDLDDLLAVGRAETNQLAYNLLARAVEYEIQPKCVANDIGILCYSPLLHGLLTGKFATAQEVPDERARTRHFPATRSMAVHSDPGCESETFGAIDAIRRIANELDVTMADLALAWLLYQPGVLAPVAGARTPVQIEQLAHAAELQLSAATLAALNEATQPVKEKLGANADMWRTESRIR